jgi:hypothetical protein
MVTRWSLKPVCLLFHHVGMARPSANTLTALPTSHGVDQRARFGWFVRRRTWYRGQELHLHDLEGRYGLNVVCLLFHHPGMSESVSEKVKLASWG